MSLKVILLHDVDGPGTAGLNTLEASLCESQFRVLMPTADDGWWPRDSLNDWIATQTNNADASHFVGIGVGSGGQSLLRSAYAQPERWPIVSAIAPACDLGRWYGRETVLDRCYANADEARQDEAPLHFNPLRRPRFQLCWCDPRDDACLPSALRVTSKLESSGVPISSDLTTTAGRDRDEYLAERADELAAWLVEHAAKCADLPELPVLGTGPKT